MSIISEALKKASYSAKKTEEVLFPPHPVLNIKIERRKTERRKVRKWRLALLVLLLALFGSLAGLTVYYLLIPYPTAENVLSEVEEESVATYSLPMLAEGLEVETDYSSLTLADVNEEINLNGIMYTPERALAIINNTTYSEGETVGKFKILEIGENFVKVASEDEEFVIRLRP